MWTSMPTNGLLIKKYAEGVARLDMLEVSIDSLNAAAVCQAPRPEWAVHAFWRISTLC